ncbi:hypothetical protein AVEN_91547-1 [Araneus ventricosus]|uniref:Gustatory receptor n=1 Tax=Araneus ventricosus TaxID=182803 RepID=A0A4Y2BIY5_ARAVE|nr:hypothetical protein AVEN_91547-1 [Araneus ventricosus]
MDMYCKVKTKQSIMSETLNILTYGPLPMMEASIPKKKHSLYPVLKSFLIFGIDVEQQENFVNSGRFAFKTWSVIITLCYHYFLISDLSWYIRRSVQENAIAESTSVWTAVLTYDLFLLNKKNISKTVRFVQVQTMRLTEKERKRFEKIVLTVCCIVWIYVCMFVIQHGAFKHRESYGEFHTTTLLHMVYKKLDNPWCTVFAKLDKCFESFFIQGFLTLTMALYILLCLSAKLWFKTFQQYFKTHIATNHNIEEGGHMLDVGQFNSSYQSLAKNVERFDNGFSQIVGIWLLMIFVTLCVRIVSVLNPLTTTTQQMLTVIVMTFSRALTALVGTSFAADAVYNESLKAISILFKVTISENTMWKNSTFFGIHLALMRYSFYPTQLTVWKFARLNRGFLMTCLGMMATYIIIAIQLYPNAMKGIESL